MHEGVHILAIMYRGIQQNNHLNILAIEMFRGMGNTKMQVHRVVLVPRVSHLFV